MKKMERFLKRRYTPSSGDCVAGAPPSPEGALKKIKEKRFPAGTALKAK